MKFYPLVLKWAKEKRRWYLRKKTEEKQNSATIMISVDQKGKVFQIELKLKRGIVWINILKK